MLPGRLIPFSSPENPPCRAPELPNIVVQIGRDKELLRLRAMVISSAGYTVHSMTPDQASAELQQAGGTRVWVFCHTLEFYELALLAVAIRRLRPADKLLRLTGLNDIRQAAGLFDELLEPVEGVDDMLRMVADLAKQ
jgi:nucleotidyltransferase/DNA polymerase involved in DNA repair